ncbi:hypothetical protein PYW08_012765 [Mythimna loreyi]|uniref:Uncharacterized protein n=1 Tax=Mythimna loreyi TaxID=667449 RepID=A0ACC2Q153_9NEOP|nr:hypothetical protein PYW08_012765 [Mythimna loreyi]
MDSTRYKKRPGTSGVLGELYESKLISLIYFRLKHDDSVEQFSLASNRDGTGNFDDICFLLKIKGFDKPLAVFLQAKHKQNNQLLKFTNETDLSKYYNSYLKIRRSFDPRNKDMIFGRNFDDTECFFILYTTAKDDGNNKIYEGIFNDYLDRLIGTGGSCTQPSYTDEDLDSLCNIVMKDEIRILAKQMAKFICNESDKEMWMNNDIMLRYHVLLALNVLDVSEIQSEGCRIASFRQEFFTNNDDFIVLIKNILCLEVLKKRKSEENDVHGLLLKFFKEPSDITTLSKLIGNVFTYKNDKLEFVSKSITHDLKRQLVKANVSQLIVYEAAELAAKDYLLSLKLKVPASFGNKDLTIRGNNKKIEKRLKYLTTKIQELLKQSKPNHIVTIDESLGDGLLQLNGGIASAVGNILVLDESSKLLKFTNNCDSLGNLAKAWYETLTSEINNVHEYKFDVKVKNFPRLSFARGEFDVSLVRDFYSKLLFCTNQANQNDVEKILREEIEDHPCNDVRNFRVRSELIFLKYHHEIQRLWLLPEGSYLTEKSKVFENAVANVMNEPLMGVMKNMLIIKNKVLKFNENVINRLLHEQIIGTIIVSGSCVLTVAKVEQYLESKYRVVLDLEYILKLPLTSYNTLCKELTNTSMDSIFIVVCNPIRDLRDFDRRLENIAKAIEGKQTIVVTNKMSADIMKEYFFQNSKVWVDERSNFTDLSIESQKNFLKTYKIKFQGEYVILDNIVDDESVGLIDKSVFYKLINDETVEIAASIYEKFNNFNKIDNECWYCYRNNFNKIDNECRYCYRIHNKYEKQFYIDRRVSRTKTQKDDKSDDVKNKVVKTLYDLEDDVVIITAEQGMGKTTFLSHLSLKTKELNPKVWIVRINSCDFHQYFRRCHRYSTEKILEFICQAALGDKSIELEWDGGFDRPIPVRINPLDHIEVSPFHYYVSKKIKVKGPVEYDFSNANDCCLCNPKVFQVKMFLHYYNRGKLVLLIDEFHEHIPELKEIVDECLKRKHKIWITTSSNLKLGFGSSYKIEYFSRSEQKIYLNLLWKFMMQCKNLYTIQKIEEIVDHMQIENKEILRAYVLLLEFLKAESMASGIDFAYDEYYNNFKMRYRLCESTIPDFPNDTTPKQLHAIAHYFDKTALNHYLLLFSESESE